MTKILSYEWGTPYSTAIPEFILVTPASVHDVRILDLIRFEANNFYIMDRGYIDYKRLFRIHEQDAYFVTRAKDNMRYRRVYSHEKDTDAGVLYDQFVKLDNYYASIDYPVMIRRISTGIQIRGRHWSFSRTTFNSKQPTSHNYTRIVGRSNCSSSGSNST